MLELGVITAVTRGGCVVAILRDTRSTALSAQSPLPSSTDRGPRRLSDAPGDYSREVASIQRRSLRLVSGWPRSAVCSPPSATRMVRRLLALAEQELGPPPCPVIVDRARLGGAPGAGAAQRPGQRLVYGARGRARATTSAPSPSSRSTGCARAAFPRCPGDDMATSWCKPLAEWQASFGSGCRSPSPALLEGADLPHFRGCAWRALARAARPDPRVGGRRALFLHNLARAVLRFRPPLGPLGGSAPTTAAIDLKDGGIGPIVMWPVLYALAAGAGARPTLERLEVAADHGTLSTRGRGDPRRKLSLPHASAPAGADPQPAPRRAADQPTSLDALIPLERRRLSEALRAVRKQQDAAALRSPVEIEAPTGIEPVLL